jgi:serine/threonine protein phosphatase PrpC
MTRILPALRYVKAPHQGVLDMQRSRVGGLCVNPEGSGRDENQDSALIKIFEPEILMVLADGMGGCNRPALASSLVIEAFLEKFDALPKDCGQAFRDACFAASTAICKETSGGGSTVEAFFVDGNRATFGHMGDSRSYLIRNNRIELLFSDHSVRSHIFMDKNSFLWWKPRLSSHRHLEQYYEALNSKEYRQHVNLLGSFAGLHFYEQYSPPEIKTLTLEPKDAVLLCSDGLNCLAWKDFCSLARTITDNKALGSARLFCSSVADPHDNITVLIYIHQ